MPTFFKLKVYFALPPPHPSPTLPCPKDPVQWIRIYLWESYKQHSCFLVFSSYLNSKQTQLSIISVPALQEPSTAGESHRIEQINVSYHSTIFTHLKWTLNIAHQSSWSIHFFSISLPTMTISNALQTFSSSFISSLSTDNAELQLYRENCISWIGNNFYFYLFLPNLLIPTRSSHFLS